MAHGKRAQICLSTDDHGIAVWKALEILHAPFLNAAKSLGSEILGSVAHLLTTWNLWIIPQNPQPIYNVFP